VSLINHESIIFQNSNSLRTRPLKLDNFSQYVKTLNSRLSALYQEAADEDSFIPASLLPKTFKELGTVSEELQVALEELLQQRDELLVTRYALEAECQRYESLFNLAPDAYIVTDNQGIIREANRAACHLFNLSQEFLIGKPLANFVILEDRRKFRTELSLSLEHHFVKDFEVRMQPRHGEVFQATLRVSSLRNDSVEPIELRFCVRNNVLSHRVTSSHANGNGSACNLSSELSETQRSLHFFSKGEIIPFNPQAVWLVLEGVVKLSTMNDSGEEVIMGLATSQMPFGPSLTSLEIYEATAISERVELMSVSLAEISSTATLSHLFVSHLNQRVRQGEAFLSIYGRRRVKDRLVQLLKLLKQEIGEATPTGTRLKVRLTHQELADACCTTRVTITRLINQLQKQNKVTLDPQNHLIICQEDF
jgi:PAS domain S-box-containing protein